MNTYWLCGWRVVSEFPIRDLLSRDSDDCPPDLTIRLGRVPDLLDDVVIRRPLLQIARNGVCRFAISDVAAYLIDSAGTEIIVDPRRDPSDPDVRVFLLGTVLGIVCHKRGLLPLHASCVVIDGHAVAFGGPSGIGKSTLAAAFVRQGFPVLADDVTVLDLSTPGAPAVLPLFPRLKLWRESMDFLDLDTAGLESSRVDLQKYHLPVEHAFVPQPTPLAALYHLRHASEPRYETTELLSGVRAMRGAAETVYRSGAAGALCGAKHIFMALGRLCSAVPSHALAYHPDLQTLGARVNAIAARHTHPQ